ncbi:unnamed protein product [Closterium sp. NIES-65]|nr:unnamed protein product [Closterium sp. NIES-65]
MEVRGFPLPKIEQSTRPWWGHTSPPPPLPSHASLPPPLIPPTSPFFSSPPPIFPIPCEQEFAANELLPRAAEWDAQKHFPVDVLRKAAGLGFAALFVREDVGGSGLGRADGAVVFEALAHADVSTTAYLTIHNMNASIIDRFGSEEQQQKWLPALATMDLFSSYCLTEPGSGSDAAALKVRHGDRMAFISGATASDVYVVMARTDGEGPKGISCFLVEKGMPGLSFGQLEKKLGWNSQPTAAVILEDLRVPAANLIGGRGNGFRIAMTGLDGGRVNIGACSVGGAQFCLEYAQQYATDRKQPITFFQNTQFQLVHMTAAFLPLPASLSSLSCPASPFQNTQFQLVHMTAAFLPLPASLSSLSCPASPFQNTQFQLVHMTAAFLPLPASLSSLSCPASPFQNTQFQLVHMTAAFLPLPASLSSLSCPASPFQNTQFQLFGKPITAFQNTQFQLADMATAVEAASLMFGKPITAFQNTQFQLADMATAVEAASLMFGKPITAFQNTQFQLADMATAVEAASLMFGKPITAFQNTQFQLADMATAVEASRLMVRNAATAIDVKAPWATTAAAMAKR